MKIRKTIELLLRPSCFLSCSREKEEQDRKQPPGSALEDASGKIPAMTDYASLVAIPCTGPAALRPTATARDVPEHVRPWCMYVLGACTSLVHAINDGRISTLVPLI